ncbi:hypothetical protein D3C71_1718690 [compost metagenome]
MDRAGALGRPTRWRTLEQAATLANFAAVEDLLRPVDGIDDIQHGDFIRRPRQPEAATHALGGGHQPGTGQLGKDLGQVLLGYTLQLRQVAHAGLARVAPLVHQEQQAMDTVFDASTVERHINLRPILSQIIRR